MHYNNMVMYSYIILNAKTAGSFEKSEKSGHLKLLTLARTFKLLVNTRILGQTSEDKASNRCKNLHFSINTLEPN
jgi:hypothetical protein